MVGATTSQITEAMMPSRFPVIWRIELSPQLPFAEKSRQLGDVRRYPSRLIESERLGCCSVTRVGMTIDIGNRLLVGVYHLEAAV